MMHESGFADAGFFGNGRQGRSAIAPVGEMPLGGPKDGLTSSISAAVGGFPRGRPGRSHEGPAYQQSQK